MQQIYKTLLIKAFQRSIHKI